MPKKILPPVSHVCENYGCSYEPKIPGGKPLRRCGICKYRFYCSRECQKDDWQEHKTYCSVLPDGPLKPTRIQDDDPERKQVIKDLCVLLREWHIIHKMITENTGRGGISSFDAARKNPKAMDILHFRFPAHMKYDRLPFQHDLFPFRLPLLLAARVGLIQNISQMPRPARKELVDLFIKPQLPGLPLHLFGPKVVSRPEHLSPGEYESLGKSSLGIFFVIGRTGDLIPIDGLTDEDVDFWMRLHLAMQELCFVPTSNVGFWEGWKAERPARLRYLSFPHEAEPGLGKPDKVLWSAPEDQESESKPPPWKSLLQSLIASKI